LYHHLGSPATANVFIWVSAMDRGDKPCSHSDRRARPNTFRMGIEMPTPPADPPNGGLLAEIDEHSKRYLGVIAVSGAVGAGLGGPPGALVGAGIGVAGCAVHYVADRMKRKGDSTEKS
jgi:hypothetical protein